jgi:hypothetical protein
MFKNGTSPFKGEMTFRGTTSSIRLVIIFATTYEDFENVGRKNHYLIFF